MFYVHNKYYKWKEKQNINKKQSINKIILSFPTWIKDYGHTFSGGDSVKIVFVSLLKSGVL